MIIKIENPNELSDLCGPNDSHLAAIAQITGDQLFSYGNEIIIESDDDKKEAVYKALIFELNKIVAQRGSIDSTIIENLIKGFQNGDLVKKEWFQKESIPIHPKRRVFPRTLNQAEYLNALSKFEIVFGIGPAGTGKTYLAVAYALFQILTRQKKKLLLTRPVVEAGESLGFLPGDLSQKINPYLKPIYDVMDDLIGAEKVSELEEKRVIEVAPLAYMRGRSLNHCIIILDEAQNSSKTQMKMFLTRLGENSKAIITGDVTQIDLPRKNNSGLIHAVQLLKNIDGIFISQFDREDVVRNPLIKKIIKAYENEGI